MTVDAAHHATSGCDLRSPIVASAAPAQRRPRDRGAGSSAPASAPSCCRRCSRRRSSPRSSSSTAPSSRGPSSSPRPSATSRAIDRFIGAADRYLRSLEQRQGAPSTCRSSPASTRAPAAAGCARRSASRRPAPTPSSSTSTTSRRTRAARAAEMEAVDLGLIADVRDAVTIPLAVKLSPYYSSMAHFAAAAVAAGADGLVLFNRFYQPDLDLETLDVVPRLELSHRWEMRLPLRWIAILRPQLGSAVSLAASTGVGSGTDVVKALMVGADVVMMTSALLRHGPEHVARRHGRAGGLDDRPRVRVGRPAARQRQPGDGRGPRRVRARELSADAPVVADRPRAWRRRTDRPDPRGPVGRGRWGPLDCHQGTCGTWAEGLPRRRWHRVRRPVRQGPPALRTRAEGSDHGKGQGPSGTPDRARRRVPVCRPREGLRLRGQRQAVLGRRLPAVRHRRDAPRFGRRRDRQPDPRLLGLAGHQRGPGRRGELPRRQR